MGNLEKRIQRHLKRNKKKHWHLDFITTSEPFEPLEVWIFREKKFECELAELLSKNGNESVSGFGSTDCSCKSHLFKLKSLEREREKVKNLGAEVVKASEVTNYFDGILEQT